MATEPETFEKSLARLESIVSRLEGGELPLEESLALFEEGRVFGLREGSPVEREHLGIVLAGSVGNWAHREKVSFLHLKGVVETVVDRIGFPPLRWRRGGAPWLDETEGAVLVTEDGRTVGLAGRLDAALAGRREIRQPLYVAELDLSAALDELPLPRFRELPRHPAVLADMTVEHPGSLGFAELVAAVRELASELVERIELVARYTGAGLPEGAVRTTLRLVYRHRGRSLTQEEVNAAQEALREALAGRLGVTFA